MVVSFFSMVVPEISCQVPARGKDDDGESVFTVFAVQAARKKIAGKANFMIFILSF
jgi:hypothetical protein